MLYSIIIEDAKRAEVQNFVDSYGLVQQDFSLKSIYKEQYNFEYKYICCFKDGQVAGVFPFVHYHSKLGDVIHSMPYIGYGGGCYINKDFKVLKSLIEKLYKYAEQCNVLLVTICTPPFIREDISIIKEIIKPDFIHENFYQYIDLDDDFLNGMNSKNRNNLKRNLKIAQNNEVYLKEDYTEASLSYWYDSIYVPRMIETNCTVYPFSVFNELRRIMGGKRAFIQYAMQKNNIIGAGIFLKQNKSLDNFMRVIGTEYMNTNAGVMLDYWSIQYARQHQFLFYNWQSCDRVDSPIFKYKKTWGSKVDYHYYLTKIINPLDQFKQTPLREIKKEYKGIYVLPYSEFQS
ncbi:hypothetical protein [Bacillus sp. S/N-304-OC-R1]|uniref:hypothetical protein n=1 Tax=Bacillus sp. S/N-304-OC-R1 TaxID=2758034 RepID=UPI001C8E3E1A|nr:hypothetical protein [Bacillus sp. S/N-304-OC-R1]MBY0123453.1 GNAT family N-acetyltransferase [Bacillus sp. S/N-304-OC-R1]